MQEAGGTPPSVYLICYLKHPVSKGQFLISHLTVGSSSLRLLRCTIRLTVSETQCGKQVSSKGPDWTMTIPAGQVVPPSYPAPSRNASQYQAGLPFKSLTFVLPIAAWCQAVHHGFRSANVTFWKKERSMRLVIRAAQHLLSPTRWEVLGTCGLSQAWRWAPLGVMGEF